MLTLKFGRRHTALALAAALTIAAGGLAEARPSGGSSFGSRGSRTFSAPAPTPTAPSTARPMERSYTQPGPTMNPGMQAGAPRRSGFGTGLFAGLLGAGVLGMLMGHGFFGGLAGIASLFGFLLQVALFGGLAYLALRWFRGRQQPAYAGAGYARSGLGANGGPVPGGAGTAPGAAATRDGVGIGPADYKAFEATLNDVQLAYGREDVDTLRRHVTPEMAHYFTEELAGNAARGQVNRIANVRLVQGDLAEAWREGSIDYATVAMRYQLSDTMVDRASGRIVRGDPGRPDEVVEVWTFRRDRGGPWLLSAIQQT